VCDYIVAIIVKNWTGTN
jgi:hypothetical protein